MAYIGNSPIIGNFQKCDALTASSTASYTLQVGGTNVSPESVNHMLVSLNGILQAPTTSFTVSGSTLTFASSLTSSDSIDFVILLGNVLDLGVPSDATVTNAKLASDVISGETDIGGAIADADLFLIDDGAGGTLRKTAASRLKTYVGGGIVNLGTSTVSTGVSEIDIDFDYSTYKRMLIFWEGIQTVSDCAMYMRAKVGGSIDTGSNYTSGHVKKYYSGFDSAVYGGPNQAQWYVTNDIGGASNETWNSQMTIDLGSGTGMPTVHIACYYKSGAGNYDSNFGVLAYQNFSQVQGIRLYASTGNIDAGKYTVWGVK